MTNPNAASCLASSISLSALISSAKRSWLFDTLSRAAPASISSMFSVPVSRVPWQSSVKGLFLGLLCVVVLYQEVLDGFFQEVVLSNIFFRGEDLQLPDQVDS